MAREVAADEPLAVRVTGQDDAAAVDERDLGVVLGPDRLRDPAEPRQVHGDRIDLPGPASRRHRRQGRVARRDAADLADEEVA